MKQTRSVMLFLGISLAVVMVLLPPCWANPLVRIEVPSSPNPVGSGARALGMAGAFVAIADDATAASWNPGGLIQLEKPELSLVGAYVYRSEDNTFDAQPEASGSQSVDIFNLNYLSGALPFTAFNRNMIVSLNYQRLYDFNRSWQFDMNHQPHFPYHTGPQSYDYEQTGALYALGLAWCVQLVPSFSAGITLNLWNDFLASQSWKQDYRAGANIRVGGVAGTHTESKQETYSFEGYNANLGFLWHITGKWTLGGVFKSPFTADITHKVSGWDAVIYPESPAHNRENTYEYRFDDKLKMPMVYGLGLAYRLSDAFSMALDVHRTHWNDFEYQHRDGRRTSPVSGRNIDESDIDPTLSVHLGAEYLIIGNRTVIPIRGGVFYDPAPADGSPDDFYGIALGTGLAYERYIFDIAYQFRFGNDVGKSTLEHIGFSQDVREHTVYASLVFHF